LLLLLLLLRQCISQERMRQNEQQVAELTQRLAAMQREKERLESRARLLEQVVSLNLTHEARLHTNKVSKPESQGFCMW
jgi:cell division protein FtsB